ncbi:DUF5753 domain-containing protein [Kitasatospora sp. NPDC058190]|uniref:DUF5753 domain-containing protein n=1 Tax=Kitasatospora sp. NPDC058190 TaxID=3346371 RepID=UPI0036D8CA6F
MSIADLAEQVRYSKSHMANIEAAHRTPPPDLPPLLDTALPSAEGFFTRFFPLVSSDSFPDWSRRYMALEPVANTHLKFSLSIPGLWQTESYGLAFLRLGLPRASETEIRDLWAIRKARQQVLRLPKPPFIWAVLDEAALRRVVGSTEVMRGQIRRLIEIAGSTDAAVQILPIDRAHGAIGGSLTLLHFDDAPRVAYLEGLLSGQLLESPDEVTNMALVYDTLRAEALTPDDSLAWLERATEERPK